MPAPSYVNSTQYTMGIITTGLTQNLSYTPAVGNFLLLTFEHNLGPLITITSITDDGGNSWSSLSSFWGGGSPGASTWHTTATNPLTTITITWNVPPPESGWAGGAGGILLAEYANFSILTHGIQFSATQQVAFPPAPDVPQTVIGIVFQGNNTAPNPFSGPYAGGTIRQSFQTNGVSNPFSQTVFANVGIIDDLTGGGQVTESIANPQPPINSDFVIGGLIGPPAGGGGGGTGTIVVAKATSPAGASQSFTFNPSWKSSFTLTDGNFNSSTVTAPGTYSITEDSVAGWSTSVTVSNGSPTSAITVADGETVTVTYTNTESHIVIRKVTAPSGASQSFTFTPSWGGGTPFTLTDGQSHDSGALAPGTYSVVETPVLGWAITTSEDPSAIVLGAGQTITITFTNTESNIVVRKVTVPAGSSQAFTFTPSWDPTHPFTLTDGQAHDSGPLPPGTYSVVETAVDGWTTSTSSDPNAITILPGQSLGITFTNTQGVTPPPPSSCVDSDACPFTLQDAQEALGQRLDDPNHVFWTTDELTAYIVEALRTFNSLSGYWRGEFTFSTQNGVVWYDITDLAVAPNTLRPITVTDQELMEVMEYHLLEPLTLTYPLTWTGSLQYSVSDLQQALTRRRDEILQETGCTIYRITVPAVPNTKIQMPNRVMDIRRVAFIPAAAPNGAATPMFQDDLWAIQAYDPTFTTDPSSIPTTYAISTEPVLPTTLGPSITFRPNVQPGVPGTFEVLVLEAGVAFCPTGPTLVTIPDDWTWVLKWGALADLLNRESFAKDSPRAAYCERRYRDGVALLNHAPALLTMRANNLPMQIDGVPSADTYNPLWEGGAASTPVTCLTAGLNLIAVTPVPATTPVSLTADVIRNAPVPCQPGVLPGIGYGEGPFGGPPGYGGSSTTTDNTACCLQVTRDVYDVIIDYAQHLAAFKMGGAEFEATMPLYERFMLSAAQYASRLGQQGDYHQALWERSQLATEIVPRYSPGATPELEARNG